MAERRRSPGEHVLHIGVAVGYYTAILAQLLGVTGRVTTRKPVVPMPRMSGSAC
jgi:protein-L-isoaspartate O-methyltransferase